MHSLVAAGQWLLDVHSTQFPAMQCGDGGAHSGCGTQIPVELHATGIPTASQLIWPAVHLEQSPFSQVPPSPHGMPFGTDWNVQTLLLQDGEMHSLLDGGQWVLALHSTHCPLSTQYGDGSGHGPWTVCCPKVSHSETVVALAHVLSEGLHELHWPNDALHMPGSHFLASPYPCDG